MDIYLDLTGCVGDAWSEWPREGDDEGIMGAGNEGIVTEGCCSQSCVTRVDV